MRQIHTSPAPPASEFGLQSSTARMQAIGSLKDPLKPQTSFDFSFSQPRSTRPSSAQIQAMGSSINQSLSFRGEGEDSEWLSGQPQYVPKDAPKLPNSVDPCFYQPRSTTADIERWLDELAAKQRGIDRPGDDFDNDDSVFKDEPGIARQVTKSVPPPSPGTIAGGSKDAYYSDKYEEYLGMRPQHYENMRVAELPEALVRQMSDEVADADEDPESDAIADRRKAAEQADASAPDALTGMKLQSNASSAPIEHQIYTVERCSGRFRNQKVADAHWHHGGTASGAPQRPAAQPALKPVILAQQRLNIGQRFQNGGRKLIAGLRRKRRDTSSENVPVRMQGLVPGGGFEIHGSRFAAPPHASSTSQYWRRSSDDQGLAVSSAPLDIGIIV
mmetsp:Transcript_82887/g.268638  ORF Transcript_82887/g.268638 Transcript_82887/m.268638 type:complete len:388 (-) Transcript_82887:67-1230(-)